MISPEAIIAVARLAIGTPFRHQGRKAGIGLDCIGLVRHIADAFGLPCKDRTDYAMTPGLGLLERGLDAQPCLEHIAAPEDGCVVLFRISRSPQHVAILSGTRLIHAWSNAGMVCEHEFDSGWRRRVVRCYRFKEAA